MKQSIPEIKDKASLLEAQELSKKTEKRADKIDDEIKRIEDELGIEKTEEEAPEITYLTEAEAKNINEHYQLIAAKKSSMPARQREAVSQAYAHLMEHGFGRGMYPFRVDPVKEEVDPDLVSFANKLDLNSLYSVRTKPNLYIILAYKSEEKIVLKEFLGLKKIVAPKRVLSMLGGFEFFTTEFDEDKNQITIGLARVFDNLYESHLDRKGFEELPVGTLKTIMVPCFDYLKFKDSHAAKVLKWYLEIKEKQDKLSGDGKV